MVDYSKWKDIEISDDEDDTHPNIDTASLYRWRHQARLERMSEEQKQKEELDAKKREYEAKAADIKSKIKKDEKVDMSKLQKELEAVEKEEQEIKSKEEEIHKKEKLAPWNVDTISKDGFAKTILNKPQNFTPEQLTEDEKMEKQIAFVKQYEPLLKKYGLLRKFDDSKRFLQEHNYLCCEETANYLVIWCINLIVEEKANLMEHVAHQCICMQYILELAKQLEIDPRGCVASFFTRIQQADKQYKDAFEDELKSFKKRVSDRAQKRIDEAMKEAAAQEEEEKQKRLGPGGLDPVEVFETLPEVLQKCFESRDVSLLQKAIVELPEEEARYHMKRCVDSGLWVPDAKTLEAQNFGAVSEETENEVNTSTENVD